MSNGHSDLEAHARDLQRIAPEAITQRIGIMGGILALSFVVLAVKAAAYLLTGSAALLADAIESIANVVTGAFGLYCAWWSTRPPDDDHPYGHGRLEHLTAGFSGVVVAVAGVGIVREAIPAILDPEPAARLGAGLLIALVAGVANGAAGSFLLLRARRLESPSMAGEGWHLLSDTATTAGAIAGVLLARATGVHALDGVAALIFGLFVLISAARLLFEAGARLVDRFEPPLLEAIARGLERQRRPEWIEVHLLRARSTGSTFMADFHVTLPRYWDLQRVDEEQHVVARALVRELGRPGEVLVHPDPCEPDQCGLCGVAACPVRAVPRTLHEIWTAARLMSVRRARAGGEARELGPGATESAAPSSARGDGPAFTDAPSGK